MQSKAKTVAAYLDELSPDRAQAIRAVRQVILKNLPKGYKEETSYGMIGYVVPHSLYPDGYHCDPSLPLPFAGLASQKNYMSIYLMTLYGVFEDQFRDEFKKSGKKLDMGKCCVRFRKLEDLPLDVVGRAIAAVSVKEFIAIYESVGLSQRKARSSRKTSSRSSKSSGSRPAKKKKSVRSLARANAK